MIYKCKMCGGSLSINEGDKIATCEYCGTKQTLPKLDSEKKASLFDRADYFRRINEYDKAISIYELILADEKTDSEVYWLNLLCRYGIEYVEDPRTKRRIPTINRVQYKSILNDSDYRKALELADDNQKEIYIEEAEYINKIQSQILQISNKEKPFDIFICYKETDDNGKRTEDSVLAQDIYDHLIKEGYKVFFSRITLEDKLGSAYEPYIFAALNSAKVMLVVGTKKEHFEAVWVKNEWSRYLSLIKSGQNKTLVPCYKNMEPNDLPEDFSYLQAQDLNKLGFMQDITRGIDKIVGKNDYQTLFDDIKPNTSHRAELKSNINGSKVIDEIKQINENQKQELESIKSKLEKNEERSKKNKLIIICLIIFALTIGLIVFLFSDKSNKTQQPQKIEISQSMEQNALEEELPQEDNKNFQNIDFYTRIIPSETSKEFDVFVIYSNNYDWLVNIYEINGYLDNGVWNRGAEFVKESNEVFLELQGYFNTSIVYGNTQNCSDYYIIIKSLGYDDQRYYVKENGEYK